MARSTPSSRFPQEVWDGRTSSTPDLLTDKIPDSDLAARYRAEIIALEQVLLEYLPLLETIKNYGSGNSLLGVKNDGTNVEYKVLVEGSGITIVHNPNSITISAGEFEPLTAEVDSDVKVGHIVYLKANGHIDLAKADIASTTHAAGLVIEDTTANTACQYISEGQVERADWTDIAGSASLTPGATYFLSDTQAGRLMPVATNTIGRYVVRIGRAVSVTTLDVEIEWPILL